MASPQPNYFVRFSKELFDAAVRADMPATQLQIFLAVVRRTYGDRGKTEAPVSVSYLVEATGRARSGIKVAFADLLAQGVLVEVSPAKFSAARVVAIQKDYERWGTYKVDPSTIPEYLRSDWQESSLGGQQNEQGQQSEQVHHAEPNRVSKVNTPGSADWPPQGQQSEPFQDKTLKTRHPAPDGPGANSGGGGARRALRQTTCDGKPRADCRALTAHTDGAVRAALETITGRGGAGKMYDPSSRLGRSVARLCERTCDFCQVEHGRRPRPARDQECATAVNRAFADVAAYHASHGIKSLPAFLDARAARAESLHDLTGSAPPLRPVIRRCGDCGVDLTFDEQGEHCPVCGRRTASS